MDLIRLQTLNKAILEFCVEVRHVKEMSANTPMFEGYTSYELTQAREALQRVGGLRMWGKLNDARYKTTNVGKQLLEALRD